MARKLLIIGAGVAGLSAGIYGRMNGFDTEIFELHSIPGGVCTAWKRGGYLFDGCIHWLVGSDATNSFHTLWRETGLIAGQKIINNEEFFRVTDGQNTLVMYNDIDKLEAELLRISPEDKAQLLKFTGLVRKFMRFEFDAQFSFEASGIGGKFKEIWRMLPFGIDMMQLAKTPAIEFSKRFNNPFLQQVFAKSFMIEEFSMAAFVLTLAWMCKKAAGFPAGGSLPMAQNLYKRYTGLGGSTHFNSRVHKIITENNRACGIVLENGIEHRGDVVISAADGHATIFEMLEGRYLDKTVRENYETLPLFPPICQVSLGLHMDLSALPHTQSYLLKEPLVVANKRIEYISYNHFCFDPSFAPKGKSAVVSYIPADYDYWASIAGDRTLYEAEKKKVSDFYIAELNKRIPGLAEKVEVIDVATPLTYVRYTNNWRGSWEGFAPTPKTILRRIKNTLPGLDGFYMIGQWTTPGGGIPPAAKSGRDIIQLLCKKYGTPFTTTMVEL